MGQLPSVPNLQPLSTSELLKEAGSKLNVFIKVEGNTINYNSIPNGISGNGDLLPNAKNGLEMVSTGVILWEPIKNISALSPFGLVQSGFFTAAAGRIVIDSNNYRKGQMSRQKWEKETVKNIFCGAASAGGSFLGRAIASSKTNDQALTMCVATCAGIGAWEGSSYLYRKWKGL